MGIGKVAVHQIHQVLAAGLQGTGDDFKILLFSAYGSFYCDEWRSTLCEREKTMPFRFINKIQLSYTRQSTAGKKNGGERGIRTLGTLRYTTFPMWRLRPLNHLSVYRNRISPGSSLFKIAPFCSFASRSRLNLAENHAFPASSSPR